MLLNLIINEDHMAIESKSITVHPDLEQSIIEKFEMFGWTIANSQEIHSQTAHTDEDAFFVYHTTTTTNYVKLLFHRERQFDNADVIRPLENEYWENYNISISAPRLIPGKIILFYSGVICISTLIMLFAGESSFFECLPILLAGLAPVIIRHFLYYRPKKKYADNARLRCFQIEEKIEEIGS